MQTFIDASSPLFAYTPCKGCSDALGFALDGNSSAYVTRASEPVSISFNFTGSSADLHIQQPSGSRYQTQVFINGSSASTSSTDLVTADSASSYTSIQNLPAGLHSLKLRITPPAASDSNADDSLRFEGISTGLGSIVSATTKNTTIDDTAWASGHVVLSTGWNMLEKDHSNWFNTTEYDKEWQAAGENFNASISWTTHAGASTTLEFEGGSVWAFGLVGPEHGPYEVLLDGLLQGVYNATAPARAFGQVLYYTTGLAEGSHNLTLTNLVQGQRLSFDRLVMTSGATKIDDIIPFSTPVSTTAFTAPSASASSSAFTSTGAQRTTAIGVSIAGAILLTALLAWAVVIFAGWREKRKRAERVDGRRNEKASGPVSNFLRFSVNSRQQPTFQMLSDVPVPPMRSHSRHSSGPSFLHLTRLAAKPRVAAAQQPTPVQYNGKNISQPAMSPALEAALGGRTHSPLTQLKHANLSQAKQATPVKLGDRRVEAPYLNMAGGDAASQRVEFGAGPSTLDASLIPEMEERSPRRRFFGRAADGDKRGSGSSYGSAKTGNSIGSA